MAIAQKKIGIFAGYFLPHMGGVERYTDKLSAALAKMGYEVVIVTANHGKLKEYERLDKQRRVYRLPIHGVASSRYPIPKTNSVYRRLIQRIEAEKIDVFIVNTRFHLTSIAGARMGKRQHRPVLLIEHGTDHFSVGSKSLDRLGLVYEHALTRSLKKYIDKYYGVSKNCTIWLKHFSIEASGVFYNAVDPADQKTVKDYYADQYPKDELVIAYAGRLIREKGVLNLLEAFMQFRRSRPNLKARLVIAGDGPLLESIKRDYDDPAVAVLGRLDFAHVMALYKRADIFVYPSLYPEGLPTSILEAGLMNCALIATPRGGTEEVIVDGDHGIIMDGSVASLRSAIGRLAADSKLRAAMAQAVKHRIEKVFNWDAVAKQVAREVSSFNTR